MRDFPLRNSAGADLDICGGRERRHHGERAARVAASIEIYI
jgi:hypothetical protein